MLKYFLKLILIFNIQISVASSSALEAILNKIEVYSGEKNFYTTASKNLKKQSSKKSVFSKKEKTFVEQEKEKIRRQIRHKNLKEKEQTSGKNSLVDQHLNTLKQWKQEQAETIKEWKKAKDTFYQNLHLYAKYSEDTSSDKKLLKEVLEKNKKLFETKKIENVSMPKTIVLKGAMELKVKNQFARPTCSSFAGVRALELLAFSNGRKLDLSEQYFYWASKPDCQQNNCSKIGSWVGYGLEFSRDGSGLNIPSEADCPYQPVTQKGNETQLPMGHQCLNQGRLKVTSFSYSKNIEHVKDALKNLYPVVAGVKLSNNFYKNEGLILFSERNKAQVKLDHHSKGHAILIVGYIPFPKSMKNEGTGCFLVTNSWGVGWGQGGHACVSEKWLKYHKRINPYVIIKGVKI